MDIQLRSNSTIQIPYLLNCCRVLTRIIPFVFESPECAEWEEKFFWTPRLIEKVDQSLANEPGDQKKAPAQYITLPPRAEVLMTCTYFLSLYRQTCLYILFYICPSDTAVAIPGWIYIASYDGHGRISSELCDLGNGCRFFYTNWILSRQRHEPNRSTSVINRVAFPIHVHTASPDTIQG